MAKVAGVDGCPTGWFCVLWDRHGDGIGARILSRASDIVALSASYDAIAVDIPVGLTEAGPRDCDREARAVLRAPRASSVFPAPIRPALGARDRLEASEITRRADGRGVGVQSWGILPKIADVDAALRAAPAARRRIWEVHPEVSFWAWNGNRPMQHGKKSREGRRERLALVEATFGANAFAVTRGRFTKKQVADDDVLDAFAAAWTAERILRGVAQSLPEQPPRDRAGLPMGIWY